jgi:hypothetical protein
MEGPITPSLLILVDFIRISGPDNPPLQTIINGVTPPKHYKKNGTKTKEKKQCYYRFKASLRT